MAGAGGGGQRRSLRLRGGGKEKKKHEGKEAKRKHEGIALGGGGKDDGAQIMSKRMKGEKEAMGSREGVVETKEERRERRKRGKDAKKDTRSAAPPPSSRAPPPEDPPTPPTEWKAGAEVVGTGDLIGLDRRERRHQRKRTVRSQVVAESASAGYGLKEGSQAHNMLKKMGWQPGDGLGKNGGGIKSHKGAEGKTAGDMLGVGAAQEDAASSWGQLSRIHREADEAYASPMDLSGLNKHVMLTQRAKGEPERQRESSPRGPDKEKKRHKGRPDGGAQSGAESGVGSGSGVLEKMVRVDGSDPSLLGFRKKYGYAAHTKEREGDASTSGKSSSRLNPVVGKEFRKQKMKLKNKQTFGRIDINYRTPNRIRFDD